MKSRANNMNEKKTASCVADELTISSPRKLFPFSSDWLGRRRDESAGAGAAANPSRRLLMPLPPGAAAAADRTGRTADGRRRASPEESGGRRPSSELLTAGEPDVEESGMGMVVTARPSSAMPAVADMEEALRSSGIGLMETKVHYLRQTRGRASKGGNCGGASAAGGASAEARKSAAAKPLGKRGRRQGSAAAAAAEASSSAEAAVDADAPTAVVGAVAEDADEEDTSPGAISLFPSQLSRARDGASCRGSAGGDDARIDPFGDIVAEAHLVEEDDDNSDMAVRSVTIDYGPSTDDPPVFGMPITTAKRVSPLVRFAQDHCALVSVLGLLVVGGIAGLSAFLATHGGGGPDNPAPGPAPGPDFTGGFLPDRLSDAPTPSPTVSSAPSISSAPSRMPTASPSTAPSVPCNMLSAQRTSDIADVIEALLPDPNVLDNNASAQSLALKWLANDDGLHPQLCPSQDALRLEQRFGLAMLHFALGGDAGNGGGGWRYASSEDHFLDPINECDWAGVDCNSDTRRATRIELGGRNMRGTLPGELFSIFGDLKVLNLADNRINGQVPPQLGNASDLEFLYLSANDITGPLPPAALAGLSKLKELELFSNALTGLLPADALSRLGNLRRVLLDKNLFTGGVPPEIGDLRSLKALDLSDNLLRGTLPDELYGLSDLVSFHLNNNGINGTLSSMMSSLSSLEELFLHRNRLSGTIPPALAELSNLRELTLSRNQLRGTLPEGIGELSALERARFDDNRAIGGTLPVSVARLARLEVLAIQGTGINGAVGDAICALKTPGDGGGGRLRKLSADCDEDSVCDGDRGVCCLCCDCTPPETGYDFPVGPQCLPYGKDVDEEEGATAPPLPPRAELVLQKILDYNVSDESALSEPSSPQGMALSWIVSEDELSLDPESPSLLQRYAMAVLFFSTGGDGWLQCSAREGSVCDAAAFVGKAPFLSAASACDWAGIDCGFRDGIIFSIRLENNGLKGDIPLKELSGLCLRTLSFSSNFGISIDVGSPHLGELSRRLRELDLSENALTGLLDDALFGSRYLFLNGNRFNGTIPSDISAGGMQSLRLDYNELTGNIPAGFGSSNLRNLRLDNNLLVGTVPEALGSLESLEFLTLNNNELTGSVPDSLCVITFDNGGVLEDLWADCEQGLGMIQIKCDCCSRCFV